MNAVSTLAVSSLAVCLFLAGPGDVVAGQPPAVAGGATLVEFSSSRCPHCQSMQAVVQQVAAKGVAVQVVDVEQQLAFAQQHQVKGVPTFVALRGGQEVGRIEGVTTVEKLVALVGARESGLGARDSGLGARDSGLGARDSGLGNRESWDRGQESGVRGQRAEQVARAASVRVKVEDATGYGFGTGTVIDAHDQEVLVVTCGHLFRESQGKGKITADLFSAGAAQTADGQLVAYDLDRDIALISLRTTVAVRPAPIAPPGFAVRPGDRVFTMGCDKGAEPSLRPTYITAVNKYKGRPNFTVAGQPVDGRSGGGLFSADGFLIGICNAADPADDEGLYAGLASIHWQLDQIGQADIYQRTAKVAAAASPPAALGTAPEAQDLAAREPASVAIASPPAMPAVLPASYRAAPEDAPIAAGDDTEIVFIVRSKRDAGQRSEVFVVDQAPPDLIARITHAARASGQQRAAMAQAAARANQPAAATPSGEPRLVRGQSTDAPRAW